MKDRSANRAAAAPELDFRRMLDSLADPVLVANRQGEIVYANRAVERLLDWPPGELIGRPLAVIQPPRLRPVHDAAFRRYMAQDTAHLIGQPLHVPALHRSGEEIDVELTLSALEGPNGERMVAAALRDLRERTELERQVTVSRYLSASTAAAARLTTMLDFDAVLQTVISTLIEDFDAILARIWLTDPHAHSLYLRAQGGPILPPHGAGDPQDAAHRPGNGEPLHYEALPLWVAEVIQTQGIIVSNNLSQDSRFDQAWVQRHGVRAMAALPLATAGTLQGVVVIYRRAPIESDVLEVLASFAAIVSASLNDVQLFVREQEARAEAEDARRRFQFLAEASRVLASALEPEEALSALARVIVPFLADWCVVDLVQRDGSLRRIDLVLHDPAQRAMIDELRTRFAHRRRMTSGVRRVIESGQSVVVDTIEPAMLDAAIHDPELRAEIDRFALRSYMCVPLVARDRTLGAITFLIAGSARRYGPADLALAEDLARRAAVAIDNARLYEELHEALRLRDEFLSSVSHDLKNPIAAIKGRAQMLLRRINRLPEEESARFLESLRAIESSADRMVRIISDLVDVARLRIGQPIELDRRRTDLIDLLQQVIAEQQPYLEPRTIRFDAPAEPITGAWDPARLERVFTNLLSNAGKYSPGESTISVEVGQEERNEVPMAVVAIRDEGIGIPPADLPFIFDRFYRGRNVAAVEGSGIGLAGARSIVEHHGGTITAESEEGQGATFLVTLPLVPSGS